MDKEIKKVLKSWGTSLERYGKLDGWNFSQNLSILGDYLRSKKDSNSIRSLVRQIRDKALRQAFNVELMMSLIKKALANDEQEAEQQEALQTSGQREQKNGQDVRFRYETERIFSERLRFKGGMLLRNFDVETESPYDSRKVRRIVEKRMSQAYYRMRRKARSLNPSNKDRYWEHRAIAFQLYNIGQVENVKDNSREISSHWKEMFDLYTKDVVLKKKMAYSTEQEATDAINQWKINHPMDMVEMVAYKCSSCDKWHIGHNYSLVCKEGHKSIHIAS